MFRHAASMLPFVVRGSLGRRTTVSRIHRRVRLVETDFNLHMNQAAYARIAEMGRTDWVLRSGIVKALWSAKTKPIMAEQRLVYRRELKPGQRYTLDTRAVGLDHRTVCIESHVIVGRAVHTAMYAKLIMIGPEGVMTPEQVRELASFVITEPLPVDNWRVGSAG